MLSISLMNNSCNVLSIRFSMDLFSKSIVSVYYEYIWYKKNEIFYSGNSEVVKIKGNYKYISKFIKTIISEVNKWEVLIQKYWYYKQYKYINKVQKIKFIQKLIGGQDNKFYKDSKIALSTSLSDINNYDFEKALNNYVLNILKIRIGYEFENYGGNEFFVFNLGAFPS